MRPFVPSAEQRRALVAEAEALRAELDALLGPRGVLLFPTHPRPAPRHYAPLLRPLDWVYTAVFNVTQLPATQVPMGLSRAGLPLGLQVVGASERDHVTIAVACALERELGGWVRPDRDALASMKPGAGA